MRKMNSKNARTKRNTRILKWVVGVEFLGICCLAIVSVFALRGNWLASETSQISQPTRATLPLSANTVVMLSPTQISTESAITSVVTPFADSFLSVGNLNTIPPVDIIKELTYFGGLGGGGTCFEGPYPEPQFDDNSSSSIEILQSLSITVCGVIPQETVTVEIIAPDGTSQSYVDTFNEPADWIYGRYDSGYVSAQYTLFYRPDFFDKRGNYNLVFSGENWSLDYSLEVVDAMGPQLYLTKDNYLAFSGFNPGEKGRLIVYKKDDYSIKTRIFGWTQFQVDLSGNLILENELTDVIFIAIGEQSGEIHFIRAGDDGYGIRDVYCAGALPPVDIQTNAYAQVIIPRLVLQDDRVLQNGDLIYIQDGASCENKTFVWYAEYCPNKDKCEWFDIPESGPDGYYLLPRPDVTATPNSP